MIGGCRSNKIHKHCFSESLWRSLIDLFRDIDALEQENFNLKSKIFRFSTKQNGNGKCKGIQGTKIKVFCGKSKLYKSDEETGKFI